MAFLLDVFFHYSWECRYAATASHYSRDDAATTLLSIWPPKMTKSCRPPPAFSYHDSPSLASRRTSWRYASGSAGVARLSPCPTCLPWWHWRYAPEVVSPLPRCGASLPDPTFVQRARRHQLQTRSHRSPSSAFPHITTCQNFLAINDHAEVRPLSRRAMSQLVSRRLQTGIRFLRTPVPTVPTAFLAVRLPITGSAMGLSCST